jgi:hypothetical protein
VHLLDTCREAKESLTPSSRKLLVELAPLGEDLAPVVLDLRELFDRCRPLIERTIAMVDDLFDNLAAYDLDAEDTRQLGGLYLVGGASAFVPLCKALRARYKRKIQLAPQPHAATAIGLAIASDPNADIFVREAMTRYFGVWREAERGRDKVFDSILSKDTLPAVGGKVVVHRHYRPSHSIGHLRFLECSDLDGRGQPIGDVTPWNEVRFPYDPKLIASDDLDLQAIERCHDPLAEDIVETYTHDRDGTIAVTIENRTHGYRREYVLGSLR